MFETPLSPPMQIVQAAFDIRSALLSQPVVENIDHNSGQAPSALMT
jgi:hypothetical protein